MGTGWLTPNTPPEDIGCRIIKLPDDVQLWAVFMGAFYELTLSYNWTKYGTMTEQEAADLFQAAFFDAYLVGQNTCIVPVVVQPPFWDDGTDVDDTASEEDQEWYGELEEVAALSFHSFETLESDPTLSWVENLAIWAFAGFIAYAGEPKAAIKFVPFARRFVLTFKQATAGAIVRVFFDGLHLADIDTYGVEGKLINFLVDIGVEPEGQDLWVEHSGEHNPDAEPDAEDQYTIAVVREKLEPDIPPDTRFNESCSCVQTTYDNGETWVDTPERDPRHGAYFAIPPAGEDFKCEAAGGMVELVKQSIQTLNHGVEILEIANAILIILAQLAGAAGTIFTLVTTVCEALIALGVGYINDQMDDAAYDVLLCAFFCGIEDDGSVTAFDVSRIIAQIEAHATPGVIEIMSILLPLYGEVYLQNSGVEFADPSADCDICEGCGCLEVSGGFPWDADYPKFDLITDATIVQGGDGYLYALLATPCVIQFDRNVVVSRIQLTNGGSSAPSRINITIGAESFDQEYNANFGHPEFTPTTPQETDHITIEVTAGGIGLSFGSVELDYCEVT